MAFLKWNLMWDPGDFIKGRLLRLGVGGAADLPV